MRILLHTNAQPRGVQQHTALPACNSACECRSNEPLSISRTSKLLIRYSGNIVTIGLAIVVIVPLYRIVALPRIVAPFGLAPICHYKGPPTVCICSSSSSSLQQVARVIWRVAVPMVCTDACFKELSFIKTSKCRILPVRAYFLYVEKTWKYVSYDRLSC